MIHLVNPSERSILESAGDRMPLGLLSIATELKRQGKDVKVFDLNHTDREKYFDHLIKDKPEAVGISVYTSPMYELAIDLSENVNGISPKSRTIAGGFHATFMPETLVDDFDSVVVGDGETGIVQALDKKGIVYADKYDLSNAPNLDFSFLDTLNYGINQSGKRTATIITSRGCPYLCAFCGNADRTIRFRDQDAVKHEVKDLENLGFNAFYFVDDVFTANRKRMIQILKSTKLEKRVTTRANLTDSATLDDLAKEGVNWISFGIESGNNEVLELSNKGMTTYQNEQAVFGASTRGINTKGFFIIGLPGETEKTAKQTIDFSLKLRDLGLNQADFYYLTPFPGTPIWNDPDKFGIKIRDRNFRNYLQAGRGAKCHVDTIGLKAERIEELVNYAREQWKK